MAELNIMALSHPLRAAEPAVAEAYVNGLYGHVSSDISSVMLAWPDGRASTMSGVYVDISARAYYKAIFKDGEESFITNALIAKGTGQPAALLIRSVKGEDGSMRMLTGLELKLSSLSDVTAGIRIGKTGYGWIIDQRGIVLAHPMR